MTQQDPGNDYPLSEVPMHARKGLASTAMVLLGFTFFTATMFAGGKLGVAFSFIDMLGVVALGNLLLGIYGGPGLHRVQERLEFGADGALLFWRSGQQAQ